MVFSLIGPFSSSHLYDTILSSSVDSKEEINDNEIQSTKIQNNHWRGQGL